MKPVLFIVLGALLLAIVLFARDGVMGGLRRLVTRLGLGVQK